MKQFKLVALEQRKTFTNT